MKQVLVTVFVAVMLILSAMTAGCASTSKSPSKPVIVVTSTTQPPSSMNVPYSEEVKITLDSPATTEVSLTMRARADAKELAGGRSFMRIKVNGKEIAGERLVNKDVNFTYNRGFKSSYWSPNKSAWYLFFSPDFVGYDNPKFDDHIFEGNAYEYKFDVSDIVNKGAPNEVIIENIGDEIAAEYTDPKVIEFYKGATIIINPILLEGKGVDVVQITKEASPVRIIVGKKSTVNLTITNNLPGSITDIEIADSPLPTGLSGTPATGKIEKPIESGGKFTVSYDVTAEKTGTYSIGVAAITFADSTGNYQKINSGTVTVTVI